MTSSQVPNSTRTPSPDLAEQEALDVIDPLRHLRKPDDDGDIVPSQPPSILNDTTCLTFPTYPVQAGEHDRVTISLRVDASPGCGGIAWPAGQAGRFLPSVLSDYLVLRGSSWLKNRQVLELGSGTGLVGLVAGKLGADVHITDQKQLLDIMNKNVEINDLQSRVTVCELNWGDKLPDVPRPSIVLAADCVYFEPAFPLLVQTLCSLGDSKDVEILFCYKKRRKADKRFFAMLKKHFTWKEVMDDPNRDVYSREAISLLTLSRKL
ncbi:hypothetical protein CONPUDRAFT_123467 [Coniophora puteana RWD-64-598 SS2]|uniref:Protein-lysine N-methyltransferase EFM6 n=1 Tax=Coniophora puteana (strain RWD-64-598) TaxID=741705 RepID=A0A5M3MTJ7_CONPW|nr:uncharacterized protein CONPUDRAFT_123467 [Coniophora puteana RWD-64-598 SS2]EIW82482.1 hypothetical protein CONPUDRAFT_123467 [Coniophora puteana RWD-64-598 SS2]